MLDGSLLTKKMSNELLEVDCLDRMIISVQGLNSETYKKLHYLLLIKHDNLELRL
jgi:hypothetical protein